jgi:hypothetical protein
MHNETIFEENTRLENRVDDVMLVLDGPLPNSLCYKYR